jgi:hypothetical protein
MKHVSLHKMKTTTKTFVMYAKSTTKRALSFRRTNITSFKLSVFSNNYSNILCQTSHKSYNLKNTLKHLENINKIWKREKWNFKFRKNIITFDLGHLKCQDATKHQDYQRLGIHLAEGCKFNPWVCTFS